MSKRSISEAFDEAEILSSSLSKRPKPAPAALLHPYPNTSSPVQPRPVPFQQPTPLTSFSYDSQHKLHWNNSALRYYRPPPVNVHLGYGYERWIRRPEERGRVDSLVRAVEKVTSTDSPSRKMNLRDVGVVAWRGVITRILTAPYEDRDGWEMNVMLVNETMYLEEHRTEAQIVEKNDINPHHRKMMYYGYAFESYCTTDAPTQTNNSHSQNVLSKHPPGWGGDVDTNIQWCSIVRTKLGDIKFIIGGEVDCVEGQYKETTTDMFVELKTSMVIRGPTDEVKFERKLLKFYFQSFLLGVPKIIVGFRTPSGQLTTIQSFNTIQIPRMIREKAQAQAQVQAEATGTGFRGNRNIIGSGNGVGRNGARGTRGTGANADSLGTSWNPSLCLDWGYGFLASLKQQMQMHLAHAHADTVDANAVNATRERETEDDPSVILKPTSEGPNAERSTGVAEGLEDGNVREGEVSGEVSEVQEKAESVKDTQDTQDGRDANDGKIKSRSRDGRADVWRVKFTPGEGARVMKLDEAAVEEVVNGEDRIGFLPRWYWDKVTSNS